MKKPGKSGGAKRMPPKGAPQPPGPGMDQTSEPPPAALLAALGAGGGGMGAGSGFPAGPTAGPVAPPARRGPPKRGGM